jgi:hypothetical protein
MIKESLMASVPEITRQSITEKDVRIRFLARGPVRFWN